MPTHHIAQFNVARLLAPLESPQTADFVAALDPINALADGTPGFVWRLQSDDGDATSIRVFDDDMVIINMSVWDSIEALSDYVYRSEHRDVLRRRREWFEKPDDAHLVLWWVPAGHTPDPDEAVARLRHLQAHGPTATAFTLRQRFPAPDAG